MKKLTADSVHRTAAAIHTELSGAELTTVRLRRLLEKCMSKIRSPKYTEYVRSLDGKLIINPVLKRVREYECTLRAVSRHIAALKAEQDSIVGQQVEKSELDEFAE